MICDMQKNFCVHPYCDSDTDCPQESSCWKGRCEVDNRLPCHILKGCCDKYPHIPVHCFRGQCSPWILSSETESLKKNEIDNRCIGCSCTNVQECKLVGSKTECVQNNPICDNTKNCGGACFRQEDCGSSKVFHPDEKYSPQTLFASWHKNEVWPFSKDIRRHNYVQFIFF